jgi:outer membrane receptor protein involved in Fe transport
LPWAATLKLLYAEAFRGPTAYELYYTDGTTQIAAKGLRPETVRSGELSYEQRVGLQRFLIGGFVSSWENMVALDNATQTEIDAAIADGSYRAGATEGSRYRNLSRIANFGGNASFEGSASSARWRYGLNVTVAHTERIAADGSSTLLTVAPQVFGNARISYELGEKKPTLGLIAFFAAPRPADRANDGGWPTVPMAPAQFDLKATLGGDVPGLAFLSYRASVTYAFGARTPYVVGPLQAASPTWPMPQLAPVDRLQLGLQLLARWP